MATLEAYFETHAPLVYPKRGKRKRANLYDKNAKKSDKDYMENYGL
jgi:hypothetical protein